jgi:hypothetical protein
MKITVGRKVPSTNDLLKYPEIEEIIPVTVVSVSGGYLMLFPSLKTKHRLLRCSIA